MDCCICNCRVALLPLVPSGCPGCDNAAGFAAQLRQLEQWRYWVSTWDASAARSQQAIKMKLRAGVPPCLRGAVWQQVVEVHSFKQQREDCRLLAPARRIALYLQPARGGSYLCGIC